MAKEKCRLCSTFEELSFEHVPPKISYNKTTRYKVSPYLDFLKTDNPLEYKIKGKIEQGGTGFYSLCRNCNSFLGANYVGALNDFIRCIAHIVSSSVNNHFVLNIKKLELLKTIKQIISMFLSINDSAFAENNPELVSFVRNPESNDLPTRYKVFTYINTEGQLRYLPILVKGNFKSQVSIVCSEITFPPLGYVLTIDYPGELKYLTEITNFKNFSLVEKTDIDLDIYKLPTHLPIPLDYRSKEEIQ